MLIQKMTPDPQSNSLRVTPLSQEQEHEIAPLSLNWLRAHGIITITSIFNALAQSMPLVKTTLKIPTTVVTEKIANFLHSSSAHQRIALIFAAIFITTLTFHSIIYHYRQNPKDNLIKLCQENLKGKEITFFVVNETLLVQGQNRPTTSYITVDKKGVRETNVQPTASPDFVSVDKLFVREQVRQEKSSRDLLKLERAMAHMRARLTGFGNRPKNWGSEALKLGQRK